MIPPLPTVNDAIGLLAALSDPDKAKATLEEMKGYIETANKVFADAQVAQRAADDDLRARAQERDLLGKARVAFEEEKNHFATRKAANDANMVEISKSQAAMRAMLEDMADKQKAAKDRLDLRAKALERSSEQLDLREKALAERELKVAELETTLKPILDKMK